MTYLAVSRVGHDSINLYNSLRLYRNRVNNLRVVRSLENLENLEMSGDFILVRENLENLEKSGDFVEITQKKFFLSLSNLFSN